MSQDTAWLTVRLHLSMAPAVLCPIGTIHTLPGRPVASRTTKHSRNRSFPEISRLSLVLPRKMLALRPFSIDFIPKIRRRGSTLEQSSILQIVSAATGSELELQEPTAETEKFAVEAGVSDDPPEAAESEVSKSVIAGSSPATRQFKRPGVTRKNEKPRIQNEELVPGATFTGKVRAIQSFGAFIDFGAFTDGLVHVSRLSDSFVKEVTDVVSVGQEVTVRILEANIETGRIALTMRRTDDPNQPRQERASDRSSNFDESSGKVVRTGKVAGRFSQKSRGETQMSSKLRKGQTVEGKVKNLVRSGAFITLPDDEEGFLPSTEVTEGFGKLSGSTGLQVGQDVTVRVLRIVRGKPTLTMKKEEDMTSLNMKINQGITEFASNPFELAFRKNPVIATFLEEQERLRKSTETAKAEADAEEHHNEKRVEAMSTTVDSAKQVVAIEQVVDDKVMEKVGTGVPQSLEEHEGSVISGTKDGLTNGHAEQADKSFTLSSKQVVDKETATKEVNEVEVDKDKVIDSASTEAKDILAKDTVKVDESSTLSTEQIADNEASSKEVSEVQGDKMKVIDSVSAEAKGVLASNPVEVDESSTFSTEQIVDKETSGKDVNDVQVTKDKVIDSASSEVKDVLANDTAEVDDSSDLKLEKPVTTLEVDLKNVSSDPQEIKDSDSLSIGALSEVNLSGETVNVPVNGSPQPDTIAEQVDDLIGQTLSTSSSEQGKIDSSKEAVINVEQLSLRNSSDFRTVAVEMKAETNTKESANAEQVDTVIGQTFSTSISKQGKIDSSKAAAINIEQPSLTSNSDFRNMAAEVKAETNATNASPISAALVKQLREETGAAMMDCKKALAETGGDLEKAREVLRKKGLASAEKKASRIAVEGRIGSYIHDSRIGVLIEVNCETDFVSRGEIFGELVEDLAMQVAASPQVEYVSVEDVSEDIVSKERELELQKEDLLNKPEHIRAKIVDGRIGKILGELALLEQPYIKNDKLLVKDWIKQTIATLGENIQVRRFARYNLGEGLEKKNQDFAAEVAAQTAVKQPPSKPAAEPKAGADSSTTTEEIKSAVEKQTAVISAALVKQLREETGAGMMDCKKALTETGGDLEKAQEFLRKKGLAGADKKSSRIAAEGRVGSYIHDSRIGVLIEVNSETDFVARGDVFKQLVEDLAMQVVACPQVQYVSVEDISKEVVNKEREIEMQREDLLGKPEQIQEKIVDGRIAKRLSELALLEQPFIKDDGILVKDIVKQAVATLGENIRVRRFIRYNLGEGLEKEAKDLSTEIAKQTLSNEQS